MYGKKTGDVEISEYSQPGFVSKFEVLSNLLQNKFGKEKTYSARNLSLFTGQLTKFMEKHAGRDSPRPTPFTRIPAEILRDFAIDGPLSLILQTCFDFRRRKGWKNIDFNDSNRVPQFSKMFQNCIKALNKKGYLADRRIFLSPKLAENPRYNVNRLRQMAEKHGAKIVDSKEQASHHVVPDQFFEENEEDYLRTLVVDKEREVAFVHWWYYPSSYDEWVPLKMVQGEPEPKKTPPQLWEIGARWLLDTDKFNEWIPEADYELEEDIDMGQPAVRVSIASQTTKAVAQPAQSVSQASPARQKKRVIPHIEDDEITDDDDEMQKKAKPNPRKRPRQDNFSKPSKRMKSDDGHYQHSYDISSHEISTPGIVDLQPQATELDNVPYTGPVLTKVTLRKPLYPVVVPSYANWFNQGMIHRVEWEAFANIIQGNASKAELYVRVRDTIVNTFRLNPRIYLSCTACRRLVTADAGLVFRIHQFLTQWNLINYFVDEGSIPMTETPNTPASHIGTMDGIVPVPAGAQHHYDHQSGTAGRSKTTSATKKRPEVDLLSSCSFSGGGLGGSYYGFIHNNEIRVAAATMVSDNLMGLSKSDFHHQFKDANANPESADNSDGGWTESNTERLIEALNIYSDDWNEIANHVGKSVEECVQRFVELPLDDTEISLHNDVLPENVSVFADGSNPIMRQAAFIASLVAPDVAAVASKAALQYMRKQEGFENPLVHKPKEWKIGERCFTKFGTGEITEVTEDMAKVRLPFGDINLPLKQLDTLYMNVDTVEDGDDETEKLRSLAAGSLGASSTNAITIASKKEKSLHGLMKRLLLLEMEKIRVKNKQLDDLWSLLERERHDIHLTRKVLLRERMELTKQHIELHRKQKEVQKNMS